MEIINIEIIFYTKRMVNDQAITIGLRRGTNKVQGVFVDDGDVAGRNKKGLSVVNYGG